MATRPFADGTPGERKRARPVPDPDSLAMDDRGTRPFRNAHPDDPPPPADVVTPGTWEDPGKLIDDPLKANEIAQAEADEQPEGKSIQDAPTIIRDVPRRGH